MNPDVVPDPDLHLELKDHRRQILEIRDEAARLTDGLNDEQARWQPSPERWSVADCIEHLNVTEEQILPVLTRTIQEAQKSRDPQPLLPERFRHGFVGNFLVRMLEPPPRWRLRAPGPYQPAAGERSFEEIRTRFADLHDRLLEQVDASRGLHLARVKMASPFARLLRLSLGQWFAFLAAHDRRHLWQARQVRGDSRFPGNPDLPGKDGQTPS